MVQKPSKNFKKTWLFSTKISGRFKVKNIKWVV